MPTIIINIASFTIILIDNNTHDSYSIKNSHTV